MKLKNLMKYVSCHVTVREEYSNEYLAKEAEFWEIESSESLKEREVARISVSTKGSITCLLIVLKEEQK